MERLSCFTHTLQLVIKDGLKEASGLSEGHKALILSQRDYAQLKELIEVLDPFLEATDLTHGERTATASGVVPDCIKAEGEKQVISTAGPEQGDAPVSPQKKLRMFSRSSKTPSSTSSRSVQAQLTADLHLIDNQASDPCSKFWQQNKSQFPVLYQVATQGVILRQIFIQHEVVIVQITRFKQTLEGARGMNNLMQSSAVSEPRSAACYAPVPTLAQHLQQSEEKLLSRMLDIFQGMMDKVQQHDTARPTQ
ncbi:hypothetical protein KUCAC02_026821, partial [Chaenocephalus aceratus]